MSPLLNSNTVQMRASIAEPMDNAMLGMAIFSVPCHSYSTTMTSSKTRINNECEDNDDDDDDEEDDE